MFSEFVTYWVFKKSVAMEINNCNLHGLPSNYTIIFNSSISRFVKGREATSDTTEANIIPILPLILLKKSSYELKQLLSSISIPALRSLVDKPEKRSLT